MENKFHHIAWEQVDREEVIERDLHDEWNALDKSSQEDAIYGRVTVYTDSGEYPERGGFLWLPIEAIISIASAIRKLREEHQDAMTPLEFLYNVICFTTASYLDTCFTEEEEIKGWETIKHALMTAKDAHETVNKT